MEKDCIFCNVELEPKQKIVLRNEHCLFLQLEEAQFKGNNLEGAGLIVPIKHRETAFDLTPEEWEATYTLLQEVKKYLDKVHKPQGYNLGWNCGEVGGQHIFHSHFHVIPRLMRKIRGAMKERDSNYLLSGTVEVDDAYFGSPRKGKNGRGTDKTKAVIALSKNEENHPLFLCIEVIDNVTIEEIKRVAAKCIKPGSNIVSDGHRSYKPLIQNGYSHEAKSYYKEDREDFLKSLHKVIGNVKSYILGTYHGLGSAYLQSYFDEFCFRFNRRFNPNEIFDRLLNACVLAGPHVQA